MKGLTVAQNPQAGETVSKDSNWIMARGQAVLDREIQAIREAANKLGPAFVDAVRLILHSTGRVAVTGLGKAGNIGTKIQATLSSTGTPAYVLHPVEALHGDLGMIRPEDVVLSLSKSGATQELAYLFPRISRIGCKIILLTARCQSPCARLADIVIDMGDTPEACPLGMAPSASTAAMLALGDALALTVMEMKNVRPEQYAEFHPSGSLGRSLMRVHQIMRTGDDCPTVRPDQTLLDYDRAVRQAPRRAGAACVVQSDGQLVGFITHGDLSRSLAEPEHPARRLIRQIMTADPKTVGRDDFVGEALKLMETYRIDELPVVDKTGLAVGMVDIQDLLAEGFSTFDAR